MPIENVSARQLNEWIVNNEAILVDVREPAENRTSHIAESQLLPLGTVQAKQLPETDKKLVIYCQRGVRGNTACEKLVSQQPDLTVYNLEGGIAAWQSEGFSVSKGSSSLLPLDRQVQITIGSFVLAGSGAAFFADPAFAGIPAFFGAGLLFAGISGTCGLALLLAKMPWNQ